MSFCEYKKRFNEPPWVIHFMEDKTRQRIDNVLIFFYQNHGGNKSASFQKWRVKYLEYVKIHHPKAFSQ